MSTRGRNGVDAGADFDAFVRASGTQLYRTAYLLCGDHHLAEDLTQSTYAKVFARWRRIAGADNPVGYARTTLINTYLSPTGGCAAAPRRRPTRSPNLGTPAGPPAAPTTSSPHATT